MDCGRRRVQRLRIARNVALALSTSLFAAAGFAGWPAGFAGWPAGFAGWNRETPAAPGRAVSAAPAESGVRASQQLPDPLDVLAAESSVPLPLREVAGSR